jgi:hypothetical protein
LTAEVFAFSELPGELNVKPLTIIGAPGLQAVPPIPISAGAA